MQRTVFHDHSPDNKNEAGEVSLRYGDPTNAAQSREALCAGNDINLSDKRDISMTFIGHCKTDRQDVIDIVSTNDDSFVHLTDCWACPKSLAFKAVIDIYKRTRFVPCPMGNTSPETLRLFECLEWGCIPLVKTYNGVDYYKKIFGEHPIPLVSNWNEIPQLIEGMSTDDIDNLILQVNDWYMNMMNQMSENVASVCKSYER